MKNSKTSFIDKVLKKVYHQIDTKLFEGVYTEEFLKSLYEILSDEVDADFAKAYLEEIGKNAEERPDSGDEKELEDEKYAMMTAAERDELKSKDNLKENLLIELGQILSEASIYDNKYSVGDKFLPLKNTADLFKMGLPPSTRVPKGPFNKISPTDDGIEVKINSGRTVYVSADDTGKNYIITASDKNIQSLFGKMKKGASATDVNFDTDTMETAACMGLYVNGVGILQGVRWELKLKRI